MIDTTKLLDMRAKCAPDHFYLNQPGDIWQNCGPGISIAFIHDEALAAYITEACNLAPALAREVERLRCELDAAQNVATDMEHRWKREQAMRNEALR